MMRRYYTYIVLGLTLVAQTAFADTCNQGNWPVTKVYWQYDVNYSGNGVVDTLLAATNFATYIGKAFGTWASSGANLTFVQGNGSPQIKVTVTPQDANNCSTTVGMVQGTSITLCIFDINGDAFPWYTSQAGAIANTDTYVQIDMSGAMVYFVGEALGLSPADPALCNGSGKPAMCNNAAIGSLDGETLKADDKQRIQDMFPLSKCKQPGSGKSGNKTNPNDTDNDGILNNVDNCPAVANIDQLDQDNDGKGDACDDDIDGDGLTNGEEKVAGTNPKDPDSDKDGLSDGDEVHKYATNPMLKDTDGDDINDFDEIDDPKYGWVNGPGKRLDPTATDTDGDGINDYKETVTYAQMNLNPTKIDTDGDTLPDGFEINYDLTNVPEFAAWVNDKFSKNFPTDYVKNNNYKNLYKFLNPKMKDSDDDGLQDNIELDLGTLPSSNDTDFDGLKDGEEVNNVQYKLDPNNPDTDGDGILDGNEVTGSISSDLKSYWQSSNKKYVFYDGKPINPTDKDTDDDTINDGDEVTGKKLTVDGKSVTYTSDPSKKDSDDDGLTDDVELALKTDPMNPDTDNDGLKDGEEVSGTHNYNAGGKNLSFNSVKTLPLNPDTDGDGVKDGKDNCPVDKNPKQEDSDFDGIGDACDKVADKGNKAPKDSCGCSALPPCTAQNLAMQGEKQECGTGSPVNYYILWEACAKARIECYSGCTETKGKLPEDTVSDQEMQSACTVFLNENVPSLADKCTPFKDIIKSQISDALLQTAVDGFINGGMQKFEQAWPSMLLWIKQQVAGKPDLIKQIDAMSESARMQGMYALSTAQECSTKNRSPGQYATIINDPQIANTISIDICYNKFEMQKYPWSATAAIGAHEAFHTAYDVLDEIVIKGPGTVLNSAADSVGGNGVPLRAFDHWILIKLKESGVDVGGMYTNTKLDLNNLCQ